MRTKVKILAVAVAVVAIAGGTLIWAPGPRPRQTKCPWPPCTETCVDPNEVQVACLDKEGGTSLTSYACCCCTPDAKHRSYTGPR